MELWTCAKPDWSERISVYLLFDGSCLFSHLSCLPGRQFTLVMVCLLRVWDEGAFTVRVEITQIHAWTFCWWEDCVFMSAAGVYAASPIEVLHTFCLHVCVLDPIYLTAVIFPGPSLESVWGLIARMWLTGSMDGPMPWYHLFIISLRFWHAFSPSWEKKGNTLFISCVV